LGRCAFTLTPALSLREREKGKTALDLSLREREKSKPALDLSLRERGKASSRSVPSPWGEG